MSDRHAQVKGVTLFKKTARSVDIEKPGTPFINLSLPEPVGCDKIQSAAFLGGGTDRNHQRMKIKMNFEILFQTDIILSRVNSAYKQGEATPGPTLASGF